MKYRVGLPGWRLAAKAGADLYLRVDVLRDDEAGVFVATSPDLAGLVAEAETMDSLVRNVFAAASDLLDWNLRAAAHPRIDLRLPDGACAA